MDVAVSEELQIYAPPKTQRKTSAQDEILQATAAAALGKKWCFFRKKQWP